MAVCSIQTTTRAVVDLNVGMVKDEAAVMDGTTEPEDEAGLEEVKVVLEMWIWPT